MTALFRAPIFTVGGSHTGIQIKDRIIKIPFTI
jgi:hypothetical protein